MKDNRQKETARQFGILAQCEALENDLLKIPGTKRRAVELVTAWNNTAKQNDRFLFDETF